MKNSMGIFQRQGSQDDLKVMLHVLNKHFLFRRLMRSLTKKESIALLCDYKTIYKSDNVSW